MLPEAVTHAVGAYGAYALFVLLALGVIGLPVPDEALMLYAGALVFRGALRAAPVGVAAVAGACCGITLTYWLGRLCEAWLLRHGRRIHLTPERVARGRAFFQRGGKWALLGGYFIPGVRHLVAYGSGLSDFRYPAFAFYAYSGAVLWCGTFLGLGYFLGEEWERYAHRIHGGLLGLAAVAILVVVLAVLVIRRRRRTAGE